MKKFLLLLGIIILISHPHAHAEKSRVIMNSWQTGNTVGSTTVRRSPLRIPIDVYYDDELHQIEIWGDENINFQIYLCDERGNTTTYSSTYITILNVPDSYSGLLYITIQGIDWISTGYFQIVKSEYGLKGLQMNHAT